MRVQLFFPAQFSPLDIITSETNEFGAGNRSKQYNGPGRSYKAVGVIIRDRDDGLIVGQGKKRPENAATDYRSDQKESRTLSNGE